VSAEGVSLRPRAGLRWRNAVGRVFAVLAASSLAIGTIVLVVLITSTLRQSLGIVPMHATAEAGLSLSLRSRTGTAAEGNRSYVTAAQVDEESPAARIGIEKGDALLAVAGRPVDSVEELWEALGALPLDGRPVAVRWVPHTAALLGDLRAEPIPGRRGAFRAVLDWVPEDTVAHRTGLRPDDVLVSAGGLPIEGTRAAWQSVVIAARAGEGAVPVVVEREGRRLEVALPAAREAEIRFEADLLSSLGRFVTRLDQPRYPERAGIASALLGSIYVILVTGAVAFPLGVAAAVYLEEYARRSVFHELLQILIANLAGIPSVVYGIIGLEILARAADLGRSVLAGGLTLALLILPVMIVASREALRAVPPWVREAAHGAGATPWQVVRHQVLPYALPGMLTGMILSLSRAIGEAAPLLLLGAFLYVTYLPESLMDTFTVVPLQIFSWATRPQAGYETVAAAAIVVLLGLLLTMNATAIFLRHRFERRW